MTVKEIKRGTNRITGKMMYLCECADGTPCLMVNGINRKTGQRAVTLFEYLLSKQENVCDQRGKEMNDERV